MTLLLAALLQQGPSIDADAGFFGDAFIESWARLSAVVANPGDEIEGELRVVLHARNAEPVIYRRDVTLPAKVRKRFAWDAHLSGWEREAEFELRGKDGKVLATSAVLLKFLTKDRERQVLQVGTALSPLLGLEESLDAAFVQTAPDRFPDTLPPLLALDAIVFPEALPLEPAQEEALLRWVELGGRLVFAPGRTSALQNRFWRDLCPLDRPATQTVRMGKGQTPVPLATGRVREGGAFLNLGEQPAGFRAARGRGEVVFLAFPADHPGVDEVFSPASLWPRVLHPETKKDEAVVDVRRGGERRIAYEGWSKLVGSLVHEESPIHPLLLLLGGAALGVYVVWIGPIHYFRLKKRGRLRKGAVAFAAVAGVFLLFSVAWATVFAARDVRLGHLVFVDEGLVQTFSILQAGESRVYELEGTGAFGPTERLFQMGLPEAGRAPTVDDRMRARIPLPALATRGLVGARLSAPGEFGLSCRRIGADGTLEIVNDGAVRLRDARLVTQTGIRLLGDVEPKSRRTVPPGEGVVKSFGEWLARDDRTRDRGFWLWWDPAYFWSEVEPSDHPFIASFYERFQRESEGRGIVRRFRCRRLDLSPLLERGEAVLAGAFEDAGSGVRLEQGAQVRTYGIVRAVVR